MLEQQVVHLPERALVRCGLRRLGCLLRARVDVVERQMAPDVGDLAVLAQQLPERPAPPGRSTDTRSRRTRAP